MTQVRRPMSISAETTPARSCYSEGMDRRDAVVDGLPGVPTVEVDLGGPVDLEKTLECGQAFRWNRTEFPGRPGLIAYSGIVPAVPEPQPGSPEPSWAGRARQLSIVVGQTAPATDTVVVAYDAGSDAPFPHSPSEVERAVLRYFSAGDDVVSIERELASKDHIMKEAAGRCHGLRILRQDPWECLASYILSANNSIPNISRTVERLADCFGEPAGMGRNAFPTPENLAGEDCVSLRRSGCGFRDRYLWDAARRVAGGEVDLGALESLPTHEARGELMKVSGVGPKVADCVLLFAYHRLEVFPVDVWVARAVSRHYLRGGHVTPFGAREEGRRRFGSLAGYAQEYLFYQERSAGSTQPTGPTESRLQESCGK